MPDFAVVFTTGPNSAKDDLKEHDPEVRRGVCRIVRQVLRRDLDPRDGDEQYLKKKPWKIRRAITRADSIALRNSTGYESSDAIQSHDIWFVFRDFNTKEIAAHEGRDGFVVDRLVDTEQLGYLLETDVEEE